MILTTLIGAVVLGMAAQVLAERLRLPAILPLLLLGIAAGPGALGLLAPSSLGPVLEEALHLGVAIILFEGGLSLDLRRLFQVGGAVRNLLSLGLVVTGVGAAVAAWALAGLPWSTAALFGAILTVTGPTVIVPLLRHMIAPQRVKTVLVSEGLIIDPIGAVLAYLVLQGIGLAGQPVAPLLWELLHLLVFGAGVGFLAGKLGEAFARSRLASGELRNLSVLALVLLCYLLAERQAPQSGILAVVVMGITMAAAPIPDLLPLKTFKEQLTTLSISVLFILLAGQLDLREVLDLGWRGVAVAVILILVVRPLSVFLAVRPGQLSSRERILLAMTAPRGIVAAAVASLASRELTGHGIAGGATLEGLVYVSILATGAWATLAALVLPRTLGFLDDPSRRRTVLVGSGPLTLALGQRLKAAGRTVVVLDSVPQKLIAMRQAGLLAVAGDARDAATYEQAGVERDTTVVALTTNDELNVLVAELVRSEFGVEHPAAALQQPSEEFGRRRRAWIDLLAGRAVDLPRWQRRLEDGRARLVDLDLTVSGVPEGLRGLSAELPQDLLLLCVWNGDDPQFRLPEGGLEKQRRVTVLVADGPARERLDELVAAPSADDEEPLPASR